MNQSFTNVMTVTKAYLEAVEFTDFGDEDQPPKGSTFAPESVYEAVAVCSLFLTKFSDVVQQAIEKHQFTYEQAGHDLWLTRNGHGSGFWDRGLDSQFEDEQGGVWILGEALTAASKTFGETNAFLHSDDLVYFE